MNPVDVLQVSPIVPPPKRNNFIQYKGGGYIIQRIKYLIAFQSFLGINRLYLIGCRNCAKHFCNVYGIILFLIQIFAIIAAELFNESQLLFKNTVAIEYMLLVFSALVLQRKSLGIFFTKLQSLDEILNIYDDIKLTSPMRLYIYGVISIILYNVLEQFLFVSYAIIENDGVKYSMYSSYMGIVAHDTEIIFFSVLLVMVSRRLRIIKAHVAKVFSLKIENEGNKEINKLEALSKKINLDVSSMHKAYDLLYKCSQQLNSVMTFPITIMIVAAGLSTILILKNLIFVLQTPRDSTMQDVGAIKVITIIGIARCIKYIILIMMPCYFATTTKAQVDHILLLQHDILNNDKKQLDKIERRKLKAFSQLCRDNAFVYELWGVLTLDMSLPLGYSSLCTTYLIILVQFSKFID